MKKYILYTAPTNSATSQLGMQIRPWDSLWSWQRKKLPRKICPSLWIIFPNVKIKKNACNQTTTLVCSMKHLRYCWKKKHAQTPSREVRISMRLLLAAGYPQSNKHASFDCWNTTSRKFIACRTTLWELGFPLQNNSQGVEIWSKVVQKAWSWSPQSFGISLYMNESEPKPTGCHVVQAAKCPGFR